MHCGLRVRLMNLKRLDDSGSQHIDTADTAEVDECAEMVWTYENVGAPFMTTWCTACHSSDLDSQYRVWSSRYRELRYA